MNHYKAPWGKSLVLMSLVGTVVCIAVSVGVFVGGSNAVSWTAWLPIVVVCLCLLSVIRGYAIAGDVLLIRRLFWTTKVPLRNLSSSEVVPNAMTGSIRVFGNGGLFSFTGLYRNEALGAYRAFVTDVNRTVVIRLQKRTVLVSPDNPHEFHRDIRAIEERATTRHIQRRDR